ncbi:MAG: hypothetical protein JRJ41_12975 [Deltaproteobacteria bacterium]|nr:hypothetical protein [Deltaproteobacteria bacterium]
MKKSVLTIAIPLAMVVVVLFQGNALAEEIYGCVLKNNGQLRIVDSIDECLKSENPIIFEGENSVPLLQGERCWEFTTERIDNEEDGDQISATIRLGFLHIGNDHYVCSGILSVPDFDMEFPAYGNAEIIGEEIYLTLSFAGVRDGEIGIDMEKAILDIDTFDGVSEGIGVYHSAITELSEGTLTSIPCD